MYKEHRYTRDWKPNFQKTHNVTGWKWKKVILLEEENNLNIHLSD